MGLRRRNGGLTLAGLPGGGVRLPARSATAAWPPSAPSGFQVGLVAILELGITAALSAAGANWLILRRAQ